MEELGVRGLERWLQKAVADGEMAGGVFGIVDRTGDVRILRSASSTPWTGPGRHTRTIASS